MLKRHDDNGVRTIGDLYVGDAFECATLEPPWKNNAEDISCIPAGRYPVIVNHSNRFNRDMPRICSVEGRGGILFHSGIKAANTKGCVLVGSYVPSHPDEIIGSKVAFGRLFGKIKAALAVPERVFITVIDLPRVVAEVA